ncbi:hypothetical protein EUX98_g3121 [Antrodiella citrinella]|uniref:Uncharacterized protein n=1 Tax=Antrodiella citrinella TaxID=2447956 RepID=A0A4S4MXB4_9APHY|nr:hypothetical protein EUX98_g3121 [Antrodiella citrinella]
MSSATDQTEAMRRDPSLFARSERSCTEDKKVVRFILPTEIVYYETFADSESDEEDDTEDAEPVDHTVADDVAASGAPAAANDSDSEDDDASFYTADDASFTERPLVETSIVAGSLEPLYCSGLLTQADDDGHSEPDVNDGMPAYDSSLFPDDLSCSDVDSIYSSYSLITDESERSLQTPRSVSGEESVASDDDGRYALSDADDLRDDDSLQIPGSPSDTNQDVFGSDAESDDANRMPVHRALHGVTRFRLNTIRPIMRLTEKKPSLTKSESGSVASEDSYSSILSMLRRFPNTPPALPIRYSRSPVEKPSGVPASSSASGSIPVMTPKASDSAGSSTLDRFPASRPDLPIHHPGHSVADNASDTAESDENSLDWMIRNDPMVVRYRCISKNRKAWTSTMIQNSEVLGHF